MQWLRHTRAEPPTLNEQQLDEIRQAQLKQLAAAADARWASIPSFLDAPSKQQQPSIASMLKNTMRRPELADIQPNVVLNNSAGVADDSFRGEGEDKAETKAKSRKEELPSPWKGIKFGKEGEPQPESWTPTLAKRR
jgi:NADH dehydrogenase [ubiquinone] 1 alpha subcomplex assembly factor 2